jgi:hypothetical protein
LNIIWLQNALLEDQLQEKTHTLQQVQDELRDVCSELETQSAVHTELQKKLTEDAAAAKQEIQDLRAQMQQMAMRSRSTHDTLGPKTDPNEPGEILDENLEEQLVRAERTINLLAAEKVQLVEAYELLEEDMGRTVDAAMAKQQARLVELTAQIEVRCLEGHALANR